MQLELQIKTNDKGDPCWDNSCNALYKVTSEEGGYVVVGHKITDPATRAKLGLADNEDVLWVPDEIIQR